MRSQVIGIIPARYASTRFPGKPLVPILGKTLLQRTYENALLASSLHHVMVATDDERIFEHVKSFGGEVVMTSETCPTGTDRLAEVIQRYPTLLEAAAIVNVQGDEPCIDPRAIDQVVQALLSDKNASMSTAVVPLVSEDEAINPSIVKCVLNNQQHALYFSRALIPGNKKLLFQPSIQYYRHIGLYAYKPSFILTYQQLPATPLQLAEDLEQLKVLENGYRIKVACLESSSSIGVDTPEDVNQVEQWICKQNTFLLQGASVPPLAKA